VRHESLRWQRSCANDGANAGTRRLDSRKSILVFPKQPGHFMLGAGCRTIKTCRTPVLLIVLQRYSRHLRGIFSAASWSDSSGSHHKSQHANRVLSSPGLISTRAQGTSYPPSFLQCCVQVTAVSTTHCRATRCHTSAPTGFCLPLRWQVVRRNCLVIPRIKVGRYVQQAPPHGSKRCPFRLPVFACTEVTRRSFHNCCTTRRSFLIASYNRSKTLVYNTQRSLPTDTDLRFFGHTRLRPS
jgi:hypothetical protein